MLRLWAVFLAAIFAGPGFALGPAELPPSDFKARQYIDSTGCVFLRDDAGGWQPRLYRDGSAICGYPPSMSARRLDPDGPARLFPDTNPTPARADQIERALTEQIIPNLQTGELSGDRAPLSPLPDMGPEPASQEPAQMLAAAVRAQPNLRSAMGRSLQPNRELCRLLNYGAPSSGADDLGRDPTEGFCDGLTRNELSRLAFMRPANLPGIPKSELRDMTAGQTPRNVAVTNPATKAAPDVGAVTRRDPEGTRLRAATVSAPKAESFQMPRFIRIGTFRTEQQMAIVATRVAALRLPVVRPKPREVGGGPFTLLVGPFDERQALVIALDRIRRAGFPGAVPL